MRAAGLFALLLPLAADALVPPAPRAATRAAHLRGSPFDFFGKKDAAAPKAAALPPVTMDADYRLAAAFLAGGAALDTVPYVQVTLGPLITLLGVLFAVQSVRVKFAFDDTSFYLGGAGDARNENVIVGGENRWTYDSFVNFETFPKGWPVPILIYFKETQTPSDKWSEGPGQSANSEEALASGAVPGQVHFFPAICNADQITAEFRKRGCKKL